ncbi:hypothetical protein EMIHUDRAFT_200715 [Emiliania huxleyi CCMP1516]|uniref:SnoaL-like domain-containing protein n=2 Tax=Emiliania huxleyi TaxID=2903 RepID=A0A0D3KR09_EMIH1|nr:hypothetical protein EMIHUDRAFT_200715 [Emiliania huxleyi CCMP1516]EOD38194.1 hypothetical protein EMIHUDRAFT_200715 [Emiliania huxleyi CCMP1516]|eukprot:XP_005790623.1 hypothetical protein EMIHUDRAFT_200715 [Emiliania huxleyi CCMP1516]
MLLAVRASKLPQRVGIARAVRVLSTSARPVPGVVGVTPSGDITSEDVVAAQAAWSNAITGITKVYQEGGDFVAAAGYCAGELYGYGHSNVLFKPTRATNNPFRPTGEDAMAYFVGAEAMKNDKFKGEDGGFAINGGQGWSEVVFRNHQIDCNGNTAIAMGDYLFTNATTGDKGRVEYTFGYKKNDDGKMRIFLHHSSMPYEPTAAASATAEPVEEALSMWAESIAKQDALLRDARVRVSGMSKP